MDFSLTNEQEGLKRVAREFAEREIVPWVKWMEETDDVPISIVRKMGEAGFAAVLTPSQYAKGIPYAGMGHVARTIILEEVSRISPAMAQTMQIHHLGQAPIIYFGSEEQKKRWLPALASGEKIAGLAMTEPYGGSDPVNGIRTKAERQGDEYILNGVKVWITNSHIADLICVVAKTGEGPKGFSVFVVEKGADGFRLGKVNKEFGLKGCNVGEIIFKNCRVSKENLVGIEGDGLTIALHAVSNVGRPGVAATALGIIHRCLEEAVGYAKRRTLYGKPIAELQAIQWLLTDMLTCYETARWLVYYSAWLRDRGQKADAENALAKFWSTEAAVQCARKLMDIFGAWGNAVDQVPQRLLRDSLPLVSAAGTNEIMRLVMTRTVLQRFA